MMFAELVMASARTAALVQVVVTSKALAMAEGKHPARARLESVPCHCCMPRGWQFLVWPWPRQRGWR